MSPQIILIGGGGHCKSCIDVIEQSGKYRIKGILGPKGSSGRSVLGYPYIGTDDDIERFGKEGTRFLICVGQIKTSWSRVKLYEKIRQAGGRFPVIISPGAYVSPHAKIGDGTIIMNKASINADARIGKNCIINTAAVIEHDVSVGDHVHISTKVVLNGGVTVKNHSFIGSNSMIREKIVIGEHQIIRAGSLVFQDITEHKKKTGHSRE